MTERGIAWLGVVRLDLMVDRREEVGALVALPSSTVEPVCWLLL